LRCEIRRDYGRSTGHETEWSVEDPSGNPPSSPDSCYLATRHKDTQRNQNGLASVREHLKSIAPNVPIAPGFFNARLRGDVRSSKTCASAGCASESPVSRFDTAVHRAFW